MSPTPLAPQSFLEVPVIFFFFLGGVGVAIEGVPVREGLGMGLGIVEHVLLCPPFHMGVCGAYMCVHACKCVSGCHMTCSCSANSNSVSFIFEG